jgi:hypothetical protein
MQKQCRKGIKRRLNPGTSGCRHLRHAKQVRGREKAPSVRYQWRYGLLLGLAVLSLAMPLRGAPAAADSRVTPLPPPALTNATPAQLKAYFASPAYQQPHRTDAEFITDLFHVILQREPDPAGSNAWAKALANAPDARRARTKAVAAFLGSPEYTGKHPAAGAAVVAHKPPRNPANVLFDRTGVFVNAASAMPADRYAPLLKTARVFWIALQIDNGGKPRNDNIAALGQGWAERWRAAGFKVGFWGVPRGVARHNDAAALEQAKPQAQADAALAVRLTAQYHGDFYIADCEDGYQGYTPADPAPALNRVYVAAFMRAARAAGIAKLPRALSSEGRIALDMKPWLDTGWDALPQAYWNSYAHYQPSRCVDFYVKEAGWPIQRVHPTIATYRGEGENRAVSLEQYAADLKTRATRGFSYYLPESYLGLHNDRAYEQLGRMAAP